jgi:ATP-dependent Lon protease
MKESVEISITYIRTKAKAADFGITQNFENIDIFIHVPKGGIPKDGPSAGTAFTTAVISSLKNKAIPKNVGMTGEIYMNGEVAEIGGLQEKILAAHRKGLKKIFVPMKNYEEEKEDIPSEINNDNDFKIIPVKNYQEIYDILF